jgi:hypothetical protein
MDKHRTQPFEEHISSETVLRFIDGELDAKEAAHVRTHLEACWSCRVSADEMQGAIARFINYRDSLYTPAVQPPPHDWRSFPTQLQRQADHPPAAKFLGNLIRAVIETLRSPFPAIPKLGARVAATLMAVLVLMWFLRYDVQSISAQELLQHVEVAQVNQLRGVSRPVVHQRLRLVSAGHTANWEIWGDPLGNRFRDRWEMDSSLTRELRQIFETNHLDWHQPLSALSYSIWRESAGAKRERVTSESNGEFLSLKTEAREAKAPGQIVQAGLIVRKRDWHPVGQQVLVKGEKADREYRLEETEFNIAQLNNENARVFEESGNESPTLLSSAHAGANSAAPLSVLPRPASPAELDAAEMAARVALHDIHADLGEPIEIVRTPTGRVEVRGLAETDQRKVTLVAALQNIPHLTTNILTLEEVQSQTSRANALAHSGQGVNPAATVVTGSDIIVSEGSPSEDRLEHYFLSQRGYSSSDAARQAAHEFTNQTTALSNSALSEAWALRWLAERYPPNEVAKLDTELRHELEAIIRDHVRALKSLSGRYQSLVQPVLASSLGSTVASQSASVKHGEDDEAAGAAPKPWPDFANDLFQTVSQIDGFTVSLFARQGTQNSSASTLDQSEVELLAAVAKLELALSRIDEEGTILTF